MEWSEEHKYFILKWGEGEAEMMKQKCSNTKIYKYSNYCTYTTENLFSPFINTLNILNIEQHFWIFQTILKNL